MLGPNEVGDCTGNGELPVVSLTLGWLAVGLITLGCFALRFCTLGCVPPEVASTVRERVMLEKISLKAYIALICSLPGCWYGRLLLSPFKASASISAALVAISAEVNCGAAQSCGRKSTVSPIRSCCVTGTYT